MQMNVYWWIGLLGLNSSTFNHLAGCQQMRYGLFKNYLHTFYKLCVCVNIIWYWIAYKGWYARKPKPTQPNPSFRIINRYFGLSKHLERQSFLGIFFQWVRLKSMRAHTQIQTRRKKNWHFPRRRAWLFIFWYFIKINNWHVIYFQK